MHKRIKVAVGTSALSPSIDRKGGIVEIRALKRMFLFIFTTSMNSHAFTPSTCLIESSAVGPRRSPAHLVATRPASLLSMHRVPWRSGT